MCTMLSVSSPIARGCSQHASSLKWFRRGLTEEGGTGEPAGDMPFVGLEIFEGQTKRAFVNHWARWTEGREMSVTEFEK